jgi:hypothetical protein
MPKIIIDCLPNGEVKIKTEGFQGQSCKDASKVFEQALGSIEKEVLLSEYYQQERVAVKAEVKNGN